MLCGGAKVQVPISFCLRRTGETIKRKSLLITTANGRANLRKSTGKGTFTLHFVGDFLVLFSRMQFTSVNFFFFTQDPGCFHLILHKNLSNAWFVFPY